MTSHPVFPWRRLLAAQKPDPEAVARATTAFALDCHRELVQSPLHQGRNTILGPASLHAALWMATAGARGPTRTELAEVLQIDTLQNGEDWTSFRRLLTPKQVWEGPDDEHRPSFEFEMANAMFGQDGIGWRENYLTELAEGFGSAWIPVDFQEPEVTRKAINEWVAARTFDRIRDLIGPDSLDPEQLLALVNASRFRACWPDPFREHLTNDAGFHLDSGETVQVPTMHGALTLRFGRLDDTTVVEIPFEGGDTAFLLAMPDDPGNLPGFEASLDLDRYRRVLASLETESVVLSLPKLEIGFKADLADLTTALGAPLAFSNQSDFSGIADERLTIGQVLHEARLTLDEKGVEATAATMVGVLRASAEPEKRMHLRVDRPFWFAIRHVPTDTILFNGHVVDPSGG